MTQRNRNYLKQEYQDGQRPSGQDFADLIDSFINISDEGVRVGADTTIALSRGLTLGDSAATTAGTLRFNSNAVQFHNGTDWVSLASATSGGGFQPIGTAGAIAYSGGNVGIGATAAPVARFEVALGQNTATAEQARVGNVAIHNGGVPATASNACLSHRDHASDSSYAIRQTALGDTHINCANGRTLSVRQNGGTVRLGVTTDGNVIVGGDQNLPGAAANTRLQVTGPAFKSDGSTAWATTSDARVKTDVHDLELGLRELQAIRPVRFRFNGKGGTDAGRSGIGVLGQEMEKVVPETISRVPAQLDGRNDELLVYDSSALTYVLINAVKELAAKVQQLEGELARSRTE
jgi:hypothetical protein